MTKTMTDLDTLKGKAFDNLVKNLDTSFITPDSINHLDTFTGQQKLALLGQYLKFRDVAPQIANGINKEPGFKVTNEQQVLDRLNDGVAKLEADPDVQAFMSDTLPQTVKSMLSDPANAGIQKELQDQYTALITNGGLFAEAKRDGLSAEETMKAYSGLVGRYSTTLPGSFLSASGRDTAGTLAGYVQSLAPTDPAAYDALLYRQTPGAPPLPKDVTDAFIATDGAQLGPLYARAFGAPISSAADQVLAQLPPNSLSVSPQEAHAKIVADLVKVSGDTFKMLRGGLKTQDAYNGLVKFATAKMDWGAGFLKPSDSSALNLYKTGVLHIGNSLVNGMALVAKYSQDGKLAAGNGVSIGALLGQSMSVLGLAAEGFGKNLGTAKPFLGDEFKKSLGSLVRPGDLENGGKVLGGIGGYLSAAFGFVSAISSGQAGDIPGAVLSGLSAGNGLFGSSLSLAEAGLHFLDGSKSAAGAIARALGYTGDAAELAQSTKVIISSLSEASGTIGEVLSVGLLVYGIVKMFTTDKKSAQQYYNSFTKPFQALTGRGFDVEFTPPPPRGRNPP